MNGDDSGGGNGRPRADLEAPELVRHEEDAQVEGRWGEVGKLGVRRRVERERVRERHPRQREELIQRRVPPEENDSGQIETLADGSISIPLFEERLVVTRQTVLRERIIVGKELATEWQTVTEHLRRERIAFETDGLPDGTVEGIEGGDGVRGSAQRYFAAASGETRPFFLTSEFAALVLTLVGLLVTAIVSDALGARWFMILAALLVAAFTLSRGFAKGHSTPQ